MNDPSLKVIRRNSVPVDLSAVGPPIAMKCSQSSLRIPSKIASSPTYCIVVSGFQFRRSLMKLESWTSSLGGNSLGLTHPLPGDVKDPTCSSNVLPQVQSPPHERPALPVIWFLI